jgi:hypothetical protein
MPLKEPLTGFFNRTGVLFAAIISSCSDGMPPPRTGNNGRFAALFEVNGGPAPQKEHFAGA